MRFLNALIAALMILQTPHAFAAGPACETVFAEAAPPAAILSPAASLRSLYINADPLPALPSDPNFKARIVDLLDMYVTSIYQENEASPFKKRELFLARRIGHNQTLELEYLADQRSGETVYRLSKLTVFKANGQDLTIDKNPLSDDGLSLLRDRYSLSTSPQKTVLIDKSDLVDSLKKSDLDMSEDGSADAITFLNENQSVLNPADQAVLAQVNAETISLPITIDGEALKALKPWLKRVPHLKKTEIRRAIESGHISSLAWKSAFLSNLDFLAKTAKKQFFKTVLLVAVFASIQNIPYTKIFADKMTPNTRAESVVSTVPKPTAIAEKQSRILSEVLRAASLDPKKHEGLAALGNANTRTPQGLAALIENLAAKEKQKGSEPVVYAQSVGRGVGTNDVTLAVELVKSHEGFILASFRKQGTLVVIPVVQNGTSIFTEAIVISEATQPQAYAALTKLTLEKLANGG